MKRKQLLLISLLGFAALAIAVPSGQFAGSGAPTRSALSAVPTKEATSQASVLSAYGKLPLTFEENQGQTDARVKFLARGSGYTVFLTDDESTTLRLSAPEKETISPRDRFLARLAKKSDARTEAPAPDAVVRLALVGANPQAQVEGNELQPGKSNYFIGNDPSRWQRNVPHFARVKYRGVYPGIDLFYYGNQGQLESDYVVAPGADPSQIGLCIDGARAKINSSGDLRLTTSTGEVVLQKPKAYQQIAGERREIATNYVQRGSHVIGLRVAPYDTSEPLVIDPTMQYSTYLGGTGSDFGNSIAVDSTLNAYVTGSTSSKDFPMPSGSTGFQRTFLSTVASAREVFVVKLNPTGSALVYSTFLGGTTSGGSDSGNGIALDSSGDAYVTGTTGATDFPTFNPFQSTDLNTGGTGFVTKLAPDGASLLYSTYIGGGNGGSGLNSSSDDALAIAVDSNGVAYITGTTTSTNFPVTANALQKTNNTGGLGVSSGTTFVSKLDPSKTGTGTLVYSTYLGGSAFEQGNSIAVEPASGIVYYTGFTGSMDFPVNGTVAAFQPTLAASGGNTDAFISKIDTVNSVLLNSTYLGGSGVAGKNGSGDVGNGIAVDASANVYVVGKTGSTNFPFSPSAFQTTNMGVSSVSGFVARLDTTVGGANSRIYASYIGGLGNDQSLGVTIDSLKNAYVVGETTSGANSFPPIGAAPQIDNNNPGGQNAYVAVVNPTGSALIFSTFWGGTSNDIGTAIALDAGSPPDIYIAGSASSADLATSTSAFQKTRNGPKNAFVTKFSGISGAAGGVTVLPATLSFGSQTVNTASAALSVTVTNGTSATITISSITFTGANSADFSQGPASTCGATLAAGANCIVSVIFTPAATGARSGNLVVTDTVDSASPHTVTLTGSGTAPGTPDFSISLAPTSATVASGGSTTVTVTVTSLTGFNSAVALTCTGAPQSSSCVLNPTSVTPAANGTITSTATITTTKFGAVPVPFSIRLHTPRPFPILGLLCLVVALVMAWMAARRGARRLAFGFALLSLLALTSCSGPLPPGTPPGTYPLTITGTSGSLSHPTQFSLTVQ